MNDSILVDLSLEEIDIIETAIYVAQFESVLPETEESEVIKRLLIKLCVKEE